MPKKTFNKKRRSQKKKMRTTYKNNNKTKDNSKSKTYSKSNIVRIFLEMLNMIKLYHWKTRSYSQHKATDELYAKMQENIDRFIEVLLGKDESRVKMMEKRIDLFDTESKMEFKTRLLKYRKFLTDLNIYFDESLDSDLLSIRDDILADLNQFLYLFSFNKI